MWLKNDTISACKNSSGLPEQNRCRGHNCGAAYPNNGALWNGMTAPFVNMTIFGERIERAGRHETKVARERERESSSSTARSVCVREREREERERERETERRERGEAGEGRGGGNIPFSP